MTFKCEAASWKVDPTVPDGAVGPGNCECSRRLEPPIPEEKDLDFKWCSEVGEQCDCDGVMRFGHTGLAEHYENNSQFFHQHPDLVRHVSVDVSVAPGLFPCDMSSYEWEKAAPWANPESNKNPSDGIARPVGVPQKPGAVRLNPPHLLKRHATCSGMASMASEFISRHPKHLTQSSHRTRICCLSAPIT